jgi:hypothetical protein
MATTAELTGPTPPRDDPKGAAIRLAIHSLWSGLGFCAVILIAVLLELFSRLLLYLNLITDKSVLQYAILTGEYALVAIDILLLIGIVGKQAWRLWKAV